MPCKLETERLLLRAPRRSDAATIVSLIGDYDVCKNLGTVPYPYSARHMDEWLDALEQHRANGEFTFGITRRGDGAYMGGCGLNLKDGKYELGYWLGKPYWGAGYATEAARRLVAFLFDELNADGVWAGFYADNPASGHVLAKTGFLPSGREMRACAARGIDVDCHMVALSRAEFESRRSP